MATTFTPTTKSADQPDIEAGMYDMRFDGTEQKRIKGGQYTKDTVNGDLKIEWGFTLLDDDGAVMYDEGEPIELSKLTGMGFNIVSSTVPAEVKVLKALCTAAEFAKFEAGEGPKEADLIGRIVQGEVFIKPTGWAGIGNVLPPRVKRSSRGKGRAVAAVEQDAD